MAKGKKGPRATKGQGMSLLKRVAEEGAIRGRLQQALEMLQERERRLVNSSGVVQSLFVTGRALCDSIHEHYPDLGTNDNAGLDPKFAQALLTFRRTIYGCIPGKELKPHETDRFETGGGAPPGAEGPDSPTDPEAPTEVGDAGGE